MPLIPCSECGKEISTKATSCPSCGAPGPAHVPECRATQRNVRTIQKTGKGLKAWQALFSVILLVAVPVLAVKIAAAGETNEYPRIGLTMFVIVISLIGLIIVRVRMWWEHG